MKIRRRDFLGGTIAAGAASVMGVFGATRRVSAADVQGAIVPVDPRCEYLRTPLGVDVAAPRQRLIGPVMSGGTPT